MNHITEFVKTHPTIWAVFVWPLLTGAITSLLKPRTPKEYAAMNPRLAACLKWIAATGLDAPKMIEAARQIVTAKNIPQPPPVVDSPHTVILPDEIPDPPDRSNSGIL